MKSNVENKSLLSEFLFGNNIELNGSLFVNQKELINSINEKLPNSPIKKSYCSLMMCGHRSVPRDIADVIVELIKLKVNDDSLFTNIKRNFYKMVNEINLALGRKKISAKDIGIISSEEIKQLIPAIEALGGNINYYEVPLLISIIRTNNH